MGVAKFASAGQTADAATEKARLIAEALATLRAAHGMDERESIALTSWVEWYDATIPNVSNIKILVGAMEIEMCRRRGQAVLDEEKLAVRQRLTGAKRFERSRDRVLDAQPAKVAEYVKRESAAGRVPSVRGAVRAVKTKPSPTKRKTSQFTVSQARAHRHVDVLVHELGAIADGERRTDAQLAALGIVDVQGYLQRVRLIPWLAIDRTLVGTIFTIDHELRAICDGRAPRPALGTSIRQYLLDLRAEITRRRKENHDDFRKRKWNSDLILKREQTSLLDWIEEQLMKVPN